MKLRLKIIILSCAGIAMLSTIFCGWRVSKNLENSKMEIAALDEKSIDLQKELKALDKTSSEITEQIVELSFKNSNEVGNEIANLQNAYIDFRKTGVSEKFGSKENIAKELEKYIAENSISTGTLPWYESFESNDTVQPVWSYVTTYGFTTDTSKMIWLCKDSSSGSLLAYMTGLYHSDTKLCDNLSLRLTSLGARSVGTSEDEDEDSGDLADRIEYDENGEMYIREPDEDDGNEQGDDAPVESAEIDRTQTEESTE